MMGEEAGKERQYSDARCRCLKLHLPRIRESEPEWKNWIECLGGGIVTGSLVLVGGDPGIGKSTLLLQVCQKLSERHIQVLYVSGEESLQHKDSSGQNRPP